MARLLYTTKHKEWLNYSTCLLVKIDCFDFAIRLQAFFISQTGHIIRYMYTIPKINVFFKLTPFAVYSECYMHFDNNASFLSKII